MAALVSIGGFDFPEPSTYKRLPLPLWILQKRRAYTKARLKLCFINIPATHFAFPSAFEQNHILTFKR